MSETVEPTPSGCVGDQVADHGVVVEGGDDAAFVVAIPAVLVQHRVGADQREKRSEVAAQPHGHRRISSASRLA